MKSKIILFSLLATVFTTAAFSVKEDDILPPTIPCPYKGESLSGWELKKPTILKKEGISEDAEYYPYHAWILNDDPQPLHCIFLTKKDNKWIKVSFVRKLDKIGKTINDKDYTFQDEKGPGVLKVPYIDKKKNIERGKKFDAWEGNKYKMKEGGKSIYPLVPANLKDYVNRFPEKALFVYESKVNEKESEE